MTSSSALRRSTLALLALCLAAVACATDATAQSCKSLPRGPEKVECLRLRNPEKLARLQAARKAGVEPSQRRPKDPAKGGDKEARRQQCHDRAVQLGFVGKKAKPGRYIKKCMKGEV